MTEWGVVGVLVVVSGLVATLVKPMLRLNTTMVTLNEQMSSFARQLKKLTDDNSSSHKRLWDKNAEQDSRLNRHELELDRLKNK